NSDGSIGTLSIPKIGLNVTAYDGDTYEAMKKGVGHIESTSCWNSNVGLAGHNRGANASFGRLKELAVGDVITYTTKLGVRTYTVTFAGKIVNNDWSWLEYTPDNRITLITCVEDQPEYRLCVQAAEK
ncbi:MAG: class D sortase, partial [Oscillospiraceae bacterium]|nr:class D sortase [Oscillospiraceae bacterium]